MNKVFKKNFVSFLLILVFLVSFAFKTTKVLATCGPGSDGTSCYKLLSPLPGLGTQVGTSTYVDIGSNSNPLSSYVLYIIRLGIGIMAVLAVIMIVVGGIQYMLAASGGEKNGGKDRITNAIFGLALALSSYLILNTLNPNLVNLKVNLPNVSFNTQSAELPKTQTVTDSLGNSHIQTCLDSIGGVVYEITQRGAGGKTETSRVIYDGDNWPSDSGGINTFNDIHDGTVTVYDEATNQYGNPGNERNATTTTNPYQIYQMGKDILVPGQACTKVQALKTDGTPFSGGSITDCTSVYGLSQRMINFLSTIDYKIRPSNPNFNVQIVKGGTACWLNNAYGPGINRIQIAKDPDLDKWVTSGSGGTPDCIGWTDSKATGGTCGGDPNKHYQYTFSVSDYDGGNWSGVRFIDEGNDWSINIGN